MWVMIIRCVFTEGVKGTGHHTELAVMPAADMEAPSSWLA